MLHSRVLFFFGDANLYRRERHIKIIKTMFDVNCPVKMTVDDFCCLCNPVVQPDSEE